VSVANIKTKLYLIRQLKVVRISALIAMTIYSCSTKTNQIDKTLLTGHWLTTQLETSPNIVLDERQNFLLLLQDKTSSDTLHFTYRLKGNTMTIFNSPKMWISENDIVKLSSDSLVYQRKGDKAVFRYGRKG
jgi:hypothetical protein